MFYIIYKIFFFFNRHNTEKVIYFLLLDRKLRQPTHDDPEDTKQRSRSGSRKNIKIFFIKKKQLFLLYFLADMPQKRIDRQRSTGGQTPNTGSYRIGQLTEGSPLVPRRQLYSNIG